MPALAVVLALTAFSPAPPDAGSGSDVSHASSRFAASALLGAAAIGTPFLAKQQGFGWTRIAADELGGTLGFSTGLVLGGLLSGPFDAEHTNRSWLVPLAVLPPVLAEAGFLLGDGLAAGEIQPRALGGSVGGLVVGAAISFFAAWLAESFPAPTHSMLAVLGIGMPFTIGGCMTAGAALATSGTR